MSYNQELDSSKKEKGSCQVGNTCATGSESQPAAGCQGGSESKAVGDSQGTQLQPLSDLVLLKRQSLLNQYQKAFPTAQKMTVSFRTPHGAEGWSQLWILPRGATLAAWIVAWGDEIRDILLGSPNESEYALQDVYFGATCGRVANRIKNASFQLEGDIYQLEANNGTNALHGSHPGFHEKNWSLRPLKQSQQEAVCQAELFSPNGEAGYPGDLQVRLTFTLKGGDQLGLQLNYEATTSATTLCNLTNHAYFNLRGHDTLSLEDHWLQIASDSITLNDSTACPTGAKLAIAGGVLDFQKEKLLFSVLQESLTHPELVTAKGLDHNFILADSRRQEMVFAAQVRCADLALTCYTDQPGLQVYTANYLQNHLGKRSFNGAAVAYPPQSGICLEAQAWPDAIHHAADGFPSIVLRPDELYRQNTRYCLVFE